MIMKEAVIVFCLIAGAACRREGSGHLIDLSDDIDHTEDEGSGLEETYEELKIHPDNEEDDRESVYDIHFDNTAYDEDYRDILINNYNYEYTEVNADTERDSVLKIAEDTFAGIEIKPKPPRMDEDFVLETSQILIMIGSAFVSFGVVMLSFFLCRRSMQNSKKQKSIPFILPDPRIGREPTPIVKDYKRVPTDTNEYLQCREDTHIEMYRGGNETDAKKSLCQGEKSGHAACDPLIE